MMVEIDVMSLTIVALLFVVWILVGAAVERSAHFFWPIDFYSCLLYVVGFVFIVILAIFDTTIPWFLILVSLVAYLLGYIVSARRKHINLFIVNPETRTIQVPYIIPYKKNGKWNVQIQRTKEHAKRVIFKIPTEIKTNWDLTKQWEIQFQDPIFPMIKIKTIITEIYNPDVYEYIKKGPFKLKKYTPECYVSPKGMADALELIAEFDAHRKDVRTVLDLTSELMIEKHQSETKNNRHTTSLLMRMFKSNPKYQLEKVISENYEKKKEEEKKQIPEHMKKGLFRRRNDG
jgi:hypothetical protein